MPSVTIPTAVSAAASVGSALIGSGAAKSAGSTQAGAANNAAQLQMNMFNQIQGNLQPYNAVGQGAIPMLQGLLGTSSGVPGSASGAVAPGPALSPGMMAAQNAGGNPGSPLGALPVVGGLFRKNASPIQDIAGAIRQGKTITDAQWAQAGFGPGGTDPNAPKGQQAIVGAASAAPNPLGATPFDPLAALKKTPGYQFSLDQGLQATQNSYASHGLAKSGAALKGAANYAEGLAGTTYEQQLQNYFQLLGGGQNAAAGIGGFGTTAAANAGNNITSAGAATAAGTVGSANAITGAIGNVAGQAISQYNQGSPGLFSPKTGASPALPDPTLPNFNWE